MDHKEIRERVLAVLKKREVSFSRGAREIGISHLTLSNIVNNRRNIAMVTLFKVEKWLERNE